MARYILTFTTPGGNYVYDREANSLLSVSDEEFVSFQRIEKEEEQEEDWELLKRYTEQGYLQETKLKEIEHPDTQYMSANLANNVAQLTLQITQNCNLRCKYCTYDGNYKHNRTHSNKTMSFDTMKKSVDFIMKHSSNVREIAIGFYGGEPLLGIDTIKFCVGYIKEKYKGRLVRYTLTTNGTLFENEVIKFLEENEFNVIISFDGPKRLHDQNRIFADGSGSFDMIMSSLARIKETKPIFFEKISFITTIAPKVDLACVNDFFSAEEILQDNSVMQSRVNYYDAKKDIAYDDMYNNTLNYQHMKTLLAALNLYSKSKTSKLFHTILTDIERFYKGLNKIKIVEKSHPSGPCMPGVMRPFVTVEGDILPCERVGEHSATMKIGHIDLGFDMDKVNAILNVGTTTEDECKVCWNFLHCDLCVAASDGGDKFSKHLRLEKCYASKYETLETLKTICLLIENGCRIREVTWGGAFKL